MIGSKQRSFSPLDSVGFFGLNTFSRAVITLRFQVVAVISSIISRHAAVPR
jgi:hypothetical protein